MPRRYDRPTTAPRIHRILLSLLLWVQGVGALVPLADARLEDHPGRVHVEDRSSDSCPQPHDHGECVLCQHLGQRFVAEDCGPDMVASAVVASFEQALSADGPLRRVVPREGGRSPPVV